MQSYLLLSTPTSIEACGGGCTGSGFSSLFNFKGPTLFVGSSRLSDQRWNSGLPTKQQHPSGGGGGGGLVVSAAINIKQDHYGLLGLSSTASLSEIKRAYRLLARKYHPDVSKHVQAGDIFKSIRLAYDVLSNEKTRTRYDHELKIREYYGRSRRRNWTHDPELEEGTRMYRWEELRRQMRREKYRQQYQAAEQGSSSYVDTEDEDEEESSSEERGSFSEVLRFTFLLLSLVQIFGSQVSLLVCSSIALVDRKLDAGYKMGYVIAWILGGRGGILLSLCLSFASWLCGKTSSSLAMLVVVGMWFSTSIARYAPVPLGALITLLYMSVKLQNDLS